jgi:hypothetical protein
LETFGQLVVDRTIIGKGVGLGHTSGRIVCRDCGLVRPIWVGVRDEDLGRVWITVAKPFPKGVSVGGIDGDVSVAWDVVFACVSPSRSTMEGASAWRSLLS